MDLIPKNEYSSEFIIKLTYPNLLRTTNDLQFPNYDSTNNRITRVDCESQSINGGAILFKETFHGH